MLRGKLTKILFCFKLIILVWPISMIILSIRFRNQCPIQLQLSYYLLLYGSLWICAFLLNIIHYFYFHQYLNRVIKIIWLILLFSIIPGYIFIFKIRNITKSYNLYPNEICNQNFYFYSSILILLVHIPLYIYIWLSMIFINSFHTERRSIRIFTITSARC